VAISAAEPEQASEPARIATYSLRSHLTGGAALTGYALGLGFWLLETGIHMFFFHGGDFATALRPHTTNELWMRSFTSVLFVLSGLLVQAYVDTLRKDRESLKKLARAVEEAGESILITDREGRIEYVNPAFCRRTGYAPTEVMGKRPAILGSGLLGAESYREMWETIAGGDVWRGRITDRRKDGHYYPLHLTIAPVLDDQGRPIRYVGIQTDLSEVVALEDALAQAQKMEFLGAFASGIAHDFNNGLTLIQAQVEQALRQAKLGPATESTLRGITETCAEQATSIRRLLAFARAGRFELETEELPLRNLWREMEGALRLTLPRGTRWSSRTNCPQVSVQGSRGLLAQAMQNLVANAAQATVGKTDARIEVVFDAFEDGVEVEPEVTALAGVRCVRIRVIDNGPGVPEALRDKIFERFFTTKAHTGTGLGLANAAATAREYGGILRLAAPSDDRGACFELFLRRGEDVRPSASAATGEVAEEPIVSGGNARVLLVDDEVALRTTTRILLESAGFRVVEAGNGVEAIATVHDDGEGFDVVALDVGMMGLRGPDVAKTLRSSHPDLPILFLTGFDDGHVLEGLASAHTDLLAKPYRLADLAAALARLAKIPSGGVPEGRAGRTSG